MRAVPVCVEVREAGDMNQADGRGAAGAHVEYGPGGRCGCGGGRLRRCRAFVLNATLARLCGFAGSLPVGNEPSLAAAAAALDSIVAMAGAAPALGDSRRRCRRRRPRRRTLRGHGWVGGRPGRRRGMARCRGCRCGAWCHRRRGARRVGWAGRATARRRRRGRCADAGGGAGGCRPARVRHSRGERVRFDGSRRGGARLAPAAAAAKAFASAAAAAAAPDSSDALCTVDDAVLAGIAVATTAVASAGRSGPRSPRRRRWRYRAWRHRRAPPRWRRLRQPPSPGPLRSMWSAPPALYMDADAAGAVYARPPTPSPPCPAGRCRTGRTTCRWTGRRRRRLHWRAARRTRRRRRPPPPRRLRHSSRPSR
jgi:hypothetical protein